MPILFFQDDKSGCLGIKVDMEKLRKQRDELNVLIDFHEADGDDMLDEDKVAVGALKGVVNMLDAMIYRAYAAGVLKESKEDADPAHTSLARAEAELEEERAKDEEA